MPGWNELFKEKEFRWDFIHEAVVDFMGTLPQAKICRILDLGSGAGRHTAHLAALGFDVSGLDRSARGLRYTCQRLAEAGTRAGLCQADMGALPYANVVFDAIISIHVIYHTTRPGLQAVLDEIWRVLRPGGSALLTFLSLRGGRYGLGEEIDPGTFILKVGADAGEPHHYSSLSELEEILIRFVITDIHLREHVENNRLSSHWEVMIQKPETVLDPAKQ